jgi:hypothetical protein
VPIVLLIIAVNPQVLFQRLVRPLRLTVRLWVVCRRPISLDVVEIEESLGEAGSELLTAIRDNVRRKPV